MLHITNGANAADLIRTTALPGGVMSWDDVLHDGPVPAGISFNQLRAVRARFIADCGWRTFEEALREFSERDRALEASLRHDEIVLWFEHDLYDQLQLLQLLDWFATCELGATTLSLICGAEYLGQSTAARLAARFPDRQRVTDAQFELARRAWAAFRSDDPTALEPLSSGGDPALPFLHAALRRHLEQFPSTLNGLSRTESQALSVLSDGVATLGDLYTRSHSEREEAVFLGDASFAICIEALGRSREPLVETAAGGPLAAEHSRAFWRTPVRINEFGQNVLAGRADHILANGMDRWLGGVHLRGPEARWRWDPDAQRLRRNTLV